MLAVGAKTEDGKCEIFVYDDSYDISEVILRKIGKKANLKEKEFALFKTRP